MMIILHKKHRGFTLIEMAIVLLIIMILTSIALPAFIRCRENSRARVCSSHLRHLQDAKDRWALDNHKINSAEPTWDDIIPTYLKVKPECPGGGIYTLGSVGDNVTCTEPGHQMY